MHVANRRFWEQLRQDYGGYFGPGLKVIEIGSYDVNGGIRDLWDPGCTYLGVDWRPGPGVDLVSLCHELTFPDETFDVVCSSSMLEHDPHWEQSLIRMVSVLKRTGALFLSWGAATSGQHNVDTAPDNQYHALPVQKVLDTLRRMNVYVERCHYETRYGGDRMSACLVGFREQKFASGVKYFESLEILDR